MSDPLDRLCDLYGVLPATATSGAHAHHTSEAAKRALLGAMGVAADSEEEVRRFPASHSSGADGNGRCRRCRW